MSGDSALATAIVAAFLLVAWPWSLWRLMRSRWLWKPVHAAAAGLMLSAAAGLATGDAGLGRSSGLGLVVLALAVMVMGRSRRRAMALTQFVAGMLLAAGLPFV